MDIKRNRWLAVAMAMAAVLFVPAQAQAQPTHAETQTKLDQYLAHAGPGAAVYAGDAADSWTVTSGTAVVNTNQPISSDDHFRAASQTKTFTAATVLLLVDEGLVELDAPIERYLPGVVAGNGYDGNVITVRQILQHSSGIAREAVDPKPNADGAYALAELVRAGLTQAPQFAPGTSFGYSNVNYYLAGMLIERLTGQSYAEAITSRIIEPLGLTETSFPGDKTLPSPYLPGYQGGRVGPFFYWWETTANLEMSLVASAGAITSTQEDLVAFELGLAGGQVLSASTLTCGGDAWGHAGDLTTGHSSLTMVTDDGRFASLVTNTFVNNADAPTRFDVIDSALCEEGTA